MIRVGIVGISGYSGKMVLSLLLKHPQVRVTYVSANNTKGKVPDIWPQLKGKTNLLCDTFNVDKGIKLCDLFFLAVPHTISMKIIPRLLRAKKRVVDLSADYRLEDISDYKKWYGVNHVDSANLSKAVYGLPEFYREEIRKAILIANPGCYPTAAILALGPLVATRAKQIQSIIIDAKSGVTGAGRKIKANFMFSHVNENLKAYKVLDHQHIPEINLYLSKLAKVPVDITFVPHLLPVDRGILETIYIRTNTKLVKKNIFTLYKKFYKIEKFIRICPEGKQPELKNVVGSNYCDIGLTLNADKQMLVITSVIDNLIKGAAGQAIQNMNLMYGFNEVEGLL